MNYTTYVPILKWKQGEYQALSKLEDAIKDRTCPLIELCPVGYDFEKGENRESLDKHLSDIGGRLKSKWDERLAFVDISCIEDFDNRKHDYVTQIFSIYRDTGCKVLPVITLKENDVCLSSFKNVIKEDKRGCVFRIKSSQFTENLKNEINRLLGALEISKSEVDLVIDFETISILGTEQTTFDYLQNEFLKKVPDINLWRSFIVAGSSFPDELVSSMSIGETTSHKRLEWAFYKDCVSKFSSNFRIPSFSDYATSTPKHIQLDMRMIKPSAKLKYTLDNYWYYNKGSAVRGPKSRGFGQFRDLCRSLTTSSHFRGKAFSAGDAYIQGCADGSETTGNLSTWVWVSTNQHLTKVVYDISMLFGFSI